MAKPAKYYLVLALKDMFDVQICGGRIKLPISDVADGCTGCCLVFDSQEAAEKYAEGKYQVFALRTEET